MLFGGGFGRGGWIWRWRVHCCCRAGGSCVSCFSCSTNADPPPPLSVWCVVVCVCCFVVFTADDICCTQSPLLSRAKHPPTVSHTVPQMASPPLTVTPSRLLLLVWRAATTPTQTWCVWKCVCACGGVFLTTRNRGWRGMVVGVVAAGGRGRAGGRKGR